MLSEAPGPGAYVTAAIPVGGDATHLGATRRDPKDKQHAHRREGIPSEPDSNLNPNPNPNPNWKESLLNRIREAERAAARSSDEAATRYVYSHSTVCV